jgi:hypothetical protein
MKKALYRVIPLTLLILICALLVSCSTSPSTEKSEVTSSNSIPSIIPVENTSGSWSVQYTLPEKIYLNGIWGTSPNNVYAAGENGTLLHYDGKTWTKMETGTPSYLSVVWGSSENDVFVVGIQARNQGIILHYDGINWSTLNISVPSLNAIWGTSSSDIFAVGSEPNTDITNRGVILHYDGKTWNKMNADFDLKIDSSLRSIWGSSSSDVFAVGFENTVIQHYDGTSWRRMVVNPDNLRFDPSHSQVLGVWGTSATDVYVIGNSFFPGSWRSVFFLLHYDGQGWNAVPGINDNFSSLWGTSSSNIFLAGIEKQNNAARHYSGVIQHYNGNNWDRELVPSSNNDMAASISVNCIWGSSASDVFAVDNVGDILHYSAN